MISGVLESIQVQAKVKNNPLKSVSRSQSSNFLFYIKFNYILKQWPPIVETLFFSFVSFITDVVLHPAVSPVSQSVGHL